MGKSTHIRNNVEGATFRRFAPDEAAETSDFRRGDFILTHGNTFFSKLIRFGQKISFWGANRIYTRWSHAALIVSEDGELIEAVGAGVKRSHINEYAPTEYHLVNLNSLAHDNDREQVCAFAETTIGQPYGILTCFSIAIGLLTGCRLTFGFDGQYVCSGLVARALERTSAIFDRSPSHILPADLAKYFKVLPPPKGSLKGRVPLRPKK